MFAGRFLSCLDTEADCERLFSQAKHTIAETRCRLDPETASDCIFCAENLELIGKDSLVINFTATPEAQAGIEPGSPGYRGEHFTTKL